MKHPNPPARTITELAHLESLDLSQPDEDALIAWAEQTCARLTEFDGMPAEYMGSFTTRADFAVDFMGLPEEVVDEWLDEAAYELHFLDTETGVAVFRPSH